MRVLIWNNHTPYIYMLATALPDVEWEVLPTRHHAPTGWREDQRPLPENVTVLPKWKHLPDVAIMQTGDDWEVLSSKTQGWPPVLHLSHNRAEYEDPGLPRWLNEANIQLVCISEMKRSSWVNAGYTRPITVIPPGIDAEHYEPWIGDQPHILTVCNGLASRPLFDSQAWLEATKGLPVRLIGEGNEGVPGAVGPAPIWDSLKYEYQHARAYLSVNKWPMEDGYNLSLLEAAATGMQCVTLAQYPPGTDTVPQWTCMRFNAVPQVRDTLKHFLSGDPRPADHSQGRWERKCVAEQFPKDAFIQSWTKVLNEVAGR